MNSSHRPFVRVKRVFVMLVLFLGMLNIVKAEPKNVAHVVVKGLSQPKKLTLLALSGLENRTGPNVFLDFGADIRWTQMDYDEKPELESHRMWSRDLPLEFKEKYPTCNEAWIDLLQKQENFKFNTISWEEFLKEAGRTTKGWIVYDDFDQEMTVAATLAGLNDALPVMRKDFKEMEKILSGMQVVFDVATIQPIEGVSRKVVVHRWMIENLLPQVKKTGLVSRHKNYGVEAHDTFVDVDQAVQEKWMVYDLTHYRDDVADKIDSRHNKPDETAALKQILSSYPAHTPVFGWGAIDENTFTRTISESGLVVICSGVPNNSFFNRWKAASFPPKMKHVHVTQEQVKVENKIYLTFMVNEGDSVKNAIHLMGHGAWINPERGQVPMNWGMDPALYERYSGLIEFYYKNATPQDYFFAAASGWGYTHPGRMTLEQAKSYVQKVNYGMSISGLNYVDIWWMPHRGSDVWNVFGQEMNVKGLTQWYNPEQKVSYHIANYPVIDSNHYYTLQDPAKFAEMLKNDYKDVSGPWFVVVYGANRHMTPYKAKTLMSLLPAEKFKAVLLDEFFTAATLAQKDIEGKVWRPGPNAPKGVAP